MNITSDDSANAPVAAQYVVTFLPLEMLHVYRQITALRAFRPIVFCQKREHAERFPFNDLVRLPKPRTHQLRRLWQKTIRGLPITIYRSEARRILAELHRVGACVLHIYFGHIGVHLLPLLEICDLPVLVSFHGADAQIDFDKPAHLARTRRMFEKSTLLLVRSDSIAERLIAAGCARAKIRLHRTGLPLAEITFTPHAPPIDGSWRCLQACRLIEKKGLATTLRAFAQFVREHPSATLTIAGEGPQLEELRSLARDLGIGARVFFPGFLSQPQLRALFAESHLFLHPSETAADGNQEGVPNSMLEAMASGVPVIATTHGGIPEAVEHGVSGTLVRERDDGALANAMLALSRDREQYVAFGAAARSRVTEDFDLAAQARILEAHYREAIKEKGSPRPA